MTAVRQVDPRVTALLDDIRLTHESLHDLTLAIRKTVLGLRPRVDEEVKYGGIMFAAPLGFCGLFVYAEHVSIEFGKGCELDDPAGLLEGSGKLRRHLKLRTKADLKGIAPYLEQACANANANG